MMSAKLLQGRHEKVVFVPKEHKFFTKINRNFQLRHLGKPTLSGNVTTCFFSAGRTDLLLDVCLITRVSMIASSVFEETVLYSGVECLLWNNLSSMLAITCPHFNSRLMILIPFSLIKKKQTNKLCIHIAKNNTIGTQTIMVWNTSWAIKYAFCLSCNPYFWEWSYCFKTQKLIQEYYVKSQAC